MPRRWVILIVAAMIAVAAIIAVVYLTPTRDGSSPERAVVLHVPEDKVTDAEWAWWQKHYPDAGLLPVIHSMEGHNGRIYSRYLLSTPKGEKEVFFATNMKDDQK
jgi:hypothetical protein